MDGYDVVFGCPPGGGPPCTGYGCCGMGCVVTVTVGPSVTH